VWENTGGNDTVLTSVWRGGEMRSGLLLLLLVDCRVLCAKVISATSSEGLVVY